MATARMPIDFTHRNALADAHPIGAVTGLQSALDGKAAAVHFHEIAGVTGLEEALADGRSEVVASVTVLSTNHPATWTADPATDTLTSSVAHNLTVNTPIAFGNGTGVLPGGLAPEPEYYWVVSVPTTTTMKVSATYGGAPVDITSAGTAGWVVRMLPSGYSTTGVFLNGFSLATQGSIDLLYSVSIARNFTYALPWLKTNATGALFYSSSGSSPSSTTCASNTTLTKKYNKVLVRMRLDMLSTGVAAFELGYFALQADDSTYSSGRTGLRSVDGGLLTFTGDVNDMRLFGGRFLSGATGVAIRRP